MLYSTNSMTLNFGGNAHVWCISFLKHPTWTQSYFKIFQHCTTSYGLLNLIEVHQRVAKKNQETSTNMQTKIKKHNECYISKWTKKDWNSYLCQKLLNIYIMEAKNLEIYIRCQKSILMNNKQINQPNH